MIDSASYAGLIEKLVGITIRLDVIRAAPAIEDEPKTKGRIFVAAFARFVWWSASFHQDHRCSSSVRPEPAFRPGEDQWQPTGRHACASACGNAPGDAA